MKTIIFALVLFYFPCICLCQDIINPYKEDGSSTTSPSYFNPALNFTTWHSDRTNLTNQVYDGEYEIGIDHLYWYDGLYTMPAYPTSRDGGFLHQNPALFSDALYLKSYSMEVVSFPFSADCAFNNINGCGAMGQTTRNLIMPPDNSFRNFPIDGYSYWEYNAVPGSTKYLFCKTGEGKFIGGISATGSKGILKWEDPFAPGTFSDLSGHSLVSITFKGGIIGINRQVLPHSVIKFTINFHCGLLFSSPLISSLTFYYDNTRGMMKYYPFSTYNDIASGNAYYDIIFKPEMLAAYQSQQYDQTEGCSVYNKLGGTYCTPQSSTNVIGPINYFPYNEVDNTCTTNPAQNTDIFALTYSPQCNCNEFYNVQPAPYSLLASTMARSHVGHLMAGYQQNPNIAGQIQKLNYDGVNSPLSPIHFEIDKNIILSNINSIDKVIYNPSLVDITVGANNLRFPSDYTFKTIRGAYPFEDEVAADDIPDYGCNGPWPLCDLRDVPVTTDLVADASSGYANTTTYPNQYLYSSLYRLQSGSKLTIEPCVWLFDCSFEVNPGAEIVLENSSTVLPKRNISKPRYQILYKGGKVTERDQTWFFQNATESWFIQNATQYRKILNYEAGDRIEAGKNVVIPPQTQGDYVVDVGSDVTFAANNYVVLKDGFHAKQGSEFHAYITPVNVPTCIPHSPRIANPNNSNNSIVKNFIDKLELSLSPNLTNSKSNLNFRIAHAGNYSICVLNALGQIQKTIYRDRYYDANEYSVSLDASDLPPGVYYCQLLGKDEQKTAKFIKVN